MFWKRIVWLTKCVFCCILGMFVAGRLADLLNPVVWWALHRNATTALSRPMFIPTYYLPLIATYGFALGLIPIHRLKELVASSLGQFNFQPSDRRENVFSRPLLWAWAPVGLVLLLRILTFRTNTDQSVLGAAYGETRFEHFFAPSSWRSTIDTSRWIFDRFVLTGPTLFLFMYTVAVWLRHQFPEPPRKSAEPEV
ncbi:hypothetical protein HDF10_004079 [Edaphobacter lichenicola]|uniref:Uncharacterized protein n=1 Tax=Tunturiibacter lichenicola TaxID=2051959 RepID=A0A7W8JB67_9BACT|nr:hypothetical protein [Edaphobacter lichenicola]